MKYCRTDIFNDTFTDSCFATHFPQEKTLNLIDQIDKVAQIIR